MRKPTALAVVLCAALLAGCSVYRVEVRQGNFMDMTKVAEVKPGMTREQVEFLLGPPAVIDAFRRDRWDYYFSIQSTLTNHRVLKKHVIVWFDGDRVRETKIIGD